MIEKTSIRQLLYKAKYGKLKFDQSDNSYLLEVLQVWEQLGWWESLSGNLMDGYLTVYGEKAVDLVQKYQNKWEAITKIEWCEHQLSKMREDHHTLFIKAITRGPGKLYPKSYKVPNEPHNILLKWYIESWWNYQHSNYIHLGYLTGVGRDLAMTALILYVDGKVKEDIPFLKFKKKNIFVKILDWIFDY